MKEAIAFFFSVILLFSGGINAFALELRLLEERTGSERTVFSYDDSGKVIEENVYFYDDLMKMRKYIYGKDGSLVKKTVSFLDTDITLLFHYDVNRTQIELENPGIGGDCFSLGYTGDQVTELLDENRRTVMVTVSSGEDFSDIHYFYVYDKEGRIQSFEIEGFRKDVFSYNQDGSFVRISTNLRDYSSTDREVYNSEGKLIRGVDQYGNTTEFAYDENGQLLAEYYEGEIIYMCEYDYDQFGRLLSRIMIYPDGERSTTTYWYDWILD